MLDGKHGIIASGWGVRTHRSSGIQISTALEEQLHCLSVTFRSRIHQSRSAKLPGEAKILYSGCRKGLPAEREAAHLGGVIHSNSPFQQIPHVVQATVPSGSGQRIRVDFRRLPHQSPESKRGCSHALQNDHGWHQIHEFLTLFSRVCSATPLDCSPRAFSSACIRSRSDPSLIACETGRAAGNGGNMDGKRRAEGTGRLQGLQASPIEVR